LFHGTFAARSAFNSSRSPTLVRQSTSSAQTLERAHVSTFDGIVFLELLQLAPGRVHRGAHAFAHRAKHREVCGVGQVLFNERDGDIEGKPRERYARLSGEIPIRPSASSPQSPAPSSPLARARARLDVARRLDDHRGGFRAYRARRRARPARVVVRAASDI
jgi:hypothetical protein